MRVLIQEVSEASVKIAAKEVAHIGKGYLLFVGFTQGDDDRVITKMTAKILGSRLFPDESGKTNLSLSQVGGSLLSVSQFTLYGDLHEGNRPSFAKALKPEEARGLFALFNNMLREKAPSLQTGVFQSEMQVSLVNEGPFTVMLDSEELWGR